MNKELEIIQTRFEAHCGYIDSCVELIKENYMLPGGLEVIKRETNDVNKTLTLMQELVKQVNDISKKNTDNIEILKDCSILMFSMMATVGYINDKMETLKEEVQYMAIDIPESRVRHMKMDWRKEE